MTFSVIPEDLERYADLLDGDAHDEIDDMRRRVADTCITTSPTQHHSGMIRMRKGDTRVPADTGNALAVVAQSHRDFQACAAGFLFNMDYSSYCAARDLRSTATDYRNTDDEHAETLASAFPGEGVVRDHPVTRQRADAFSYRTGDYRRIDNTVYRTALPDDHFDFTQYLPRPGVSFNTDETAIGSKTFARNWLGTDVDSVIALFDGDWSQVLTAARQIERLAARTVTVADNVRQGNQDLDATWNGGAAEVAHHYFSVHADHIDGQSDNLTELAGIHRWATGDINAVADCAAESIAAFLEAISVISAVLPPDPLEAGIHIEDGKPTLSIKDLAASALLIGAAPEVLATAFSGLAAARIMWEYVVVPLSEQVTVRAGNAAEAAAALHSAMSTASIYFGRVDSAPEDVTF